MRKQVVVVSSSSTWFVSKLEISSSPPALAPNYQTINPPDAHHDEDDGLHFLHDRLYGLHGMIMAFLVILIFSLFLLFVVIIPFLSRTNGWRRTCRLPTLRNPRSTTASQEQPPPPETPVLVFPASLVVPKVRINSLWNSNGFGVR